MARTLGLDLGTNSIGWAIIDDTSNQILDVGVRIFPEGVDRDKGKEISKNATRREKRQIRRQYFRKGLRKQKLISILQPIGMFPIVDHVKNELQNVILCNELKEFFQLNPYELRAKAVSGQKLELFELGRVFYHLSQRRGYRENLLSELDDSGVLQVGNAEEGKIGIEATLAGMANKTLGEYLASLNPHETRLRNRYTLRSMYIEEFNSIFDAQQKYYPHVLNSNLKRALGEPNHGVIFYQRELRNQKFLRGNCTFEKHKTRIAVSNPWFEVFRMYQFVNSVKHGQNFLNYDESSKLIELLLKGKEKIKFSDFKKAVKASDQSWNYEDEHTIPTCKTISAISKAFNRKDVATILSNRQEEEVFSILTWLESIWQIKNFARDPDWFMEYALNHWHLEVKQAEAFRKTRLDAKFGSLSLKVIRNSIPFLLSGLQYSDSILLAGVKNAFGSEWNNFSVEKRQLIVDNVIANASTDEDSLSIEKIRCVLTEGFNLNPKKLIKLYHHSDQRQMSRHMPNDSIKSIQSIKNPIVQAALFEVNTLIPQLQEKWKSTGGINSVKIEMARELKKSKKQRDIERKRNFENERFNDACRAELDSLHLPHTIDNIQRMWLWQECGHTCPYSGKEISLKQLFEDGNWQIEHIVPYSISLDDSLANKTLCEVGMNQRKGNSTPYEAFHDSPDWQNMVMRAYKYLPYHKAQRFAAKSHLELDDFISRQLNDTRYIASESRKIVAHYIPECSVTQGGVTSLLRQQWGLNGILNHRYSLSTIIPDGEYFAAIDKNDEVIENTLQRWVADPKIRKKLIEDLKKSGRVLRGQVKNNLFFPAKTRDDHRHHAVDALVVACTKTAYLQEISRLKGKDEDGNRILSKMSIDEPWSGFWHQAKDKINNMLVSHKNRKRTITNRKKQLLDKKSGKPLVISGHKIKSTGLAARGELHKAGMYGAYTHKDGESYLHERVDLNSLRTMKQVNQIVDDEIHKVVIKRLEELGVDVNNEKSKIPDDTLEQPVYFQNDELGNRIPLLFLPNKNGSPIPIKRVRIAFKSSTKIQLHGINRYVEPGNNHHIIIYEDSMGKLKEDVVTFWQAVERKRQKQPVYQLPPEGVRIETILQTNHMFILGLAEDAIDWNNPDMSLISERLYRVQKISSSDYNFRIHLASTLDFDIQSIRIRSTTSLISFNPIKVRLDRTGKLIRV